MSEEFRKRAVDLLTWLLLGVVVVGGVSLAIPKYLRSSSLEARNRQLQQRIDQCKREISDLDGKQRRFLSDRDFVELIARQNHRVLPGELVFIFDRD